MVALFEDHAGQMELTLFHNFAWIIKMVQLNVSCSVWGKSVFLPNGQKQIIYPEIIFKTANHQEKNNAWRSLYHTTEKLKRNQLDNKGMALLQKRLLSQFGMVGIEETLPTYLLMCYRLSPLKEAFKNIIFLMINRY